jgi:SAM-dependent methyltransferase
MTLSTGPELPKTWHHGLVARYWAEFNTSGPDIAYFKAFVEEGQGPALDVACGTGRLLVPFIREGLDVDGVDVSEDMIALCSEQATAQGLEPNLYCQAVHELDLPRRYRTIFMCGGFGIGGNRTHDMLGLARMREHLEPGGMLVMDHQVPYSYTEDWQYWLKDKNKELPLDWSLGQRRRARDGTEYQMDFRFVSLDPLAERVTYEMRTTLWKGEEQLAQDKHELQLVAYFPSEVGMMLERAGFTDIQVLGDHEHREARPDDDFLVFTARVGS